MALDENGEWNGVCACGKIEADGKRCIYGATHKPAGVAVESFPWAAPVVEKMPWE